MALMTFSYQDFSSPDFAAEPLTAEKLIPGGVRIDVSVFPFASAIRVTLGANAAIDATSLTVTVEKVYSSGLESVIPSGTALYFGEPKELALLTADLSVGDVSAAVQALPAAVESGDIATYDGKDNRKPIPAGTLVGRTFVERAAGTAYGLPDVATPDDELYLLAFTVQDALINPEAALLRHNTLIYEDKLPNWNSLGATVRAAIRERYHCIASADA